MKSIKSGVPQGSIAYRGFYVFYTVKTNQQNYNNDVRKRQYESISNYQSAIIFSRLTKSPSTIISEWVKSHKSIHITFTTRHNNYRQVIINNTLIEMKFENIQDFIKMKNFDSPEEDKKVVSSPKNQAY